MNDFSLLRMNLYFPIFVNETVWEIRGTVCAIPHSYLITPSHIVGDIFALLLIHHGQDGGEELAGQLRGVDALLLEAHPHPQGLQLPDGLQALLGVPGEPGGGLHQDLVHPAPPAVRQQPLEVLALLR